MLCIFHCCSAAWASTVRPFLSNMHHFPGGTVAGHKFGLPASSAHGLLAVGSVCRLPVDVVELGIRQIVFLLPIFLDRLNVGFGMDVFFGEGRQFLALEEDSIGLIGEHMVWGSVILSEAPMPFCSQVHQDVFPRPPV